MSNVARNTAAFQQTHTTSLNRDRIKPTSVFTSNRYRVATLESDWGTNLVTRLNELTSLPIGWDGYRGRPVPFYLAHFVASMLERLCQEDVPAPSLVPGSDGSVQAEWHRNGYDVELDVLDVQKVVATRYNVNTGNEEVLEIQDDFSAVIPWILALANNAKTLQVG